MGQGESIPGMPGGRHTVVRGAGETHRSRDLLWRADAGASTLFA
ncbi:MAG: hypothetical protein WCG47_20230 [Dermatophilaceae bacterium]